MIHFYDSASPENIPSGAYAAAYVNGYVWPPAEIDRMSRVIRTSVEGSAYWARYARVIDVENGAASPDDVIPFFYERARAGAHDATVYASLATLQESGIVSNLNAHGWKNPRLWVAEWDGNPAARPEVDGVKAWAKQYSNVGTRYDLNALYGTNDFLRP